MKPCPFCAEEIQDAAIVCKHCGRDVAPSAAPPKVAAARKDAAAASPAPPVRLNFVFGLLAAVVVLGAAVAIQQERSSQAAAYAAPAPPPPLPPLVIAVSNEPTLDVNASAWQSWTWEVTPDRPNCRVTGRVLGLAGGSKDVDVMVLTEDQYINLTNHHEVRPIFRSGQQTAITLDVPVSGPGKYKVVVSNAFSLLTPKTIQMQDVKVTCTS